MLTAEENRKLMETGAGTPMGELMRRYWQPIAVVGGPARPGTGITHAPQGGLRRVRARLRLSPRHGGRHGGGRAVDGGPHLPLTQRALHGRHDRLPLWEAHAG